MKLPLSSIRVSALVASAIVALVSCGEKPATPKETKPAAAAGQAANKPAPKPKDINLVALLKGDDVKKALVLDPAVKVGVDTKEVDKGIVSYIWLKPDHEKIQKKNDELLKKMAMDEAAGKPVAPEEKKLAPKHFAVLLDYGKAFPTPVAALSNLEARMQGLAKLAAKPNSTVTVEDLPGLADGAYWRADAKAVFFAKGTRVVMVGIKGAGTDVAKAKEWALAVAKAVASKLP